LLILDIDKDGVNDFAIAGWSEETNWSGSDILQKDFKEHQRVDIWLYKGTYKASCSEDQNLYRRLKASVCQAKRITGFI